MKLIKILFSSLFFISTSLIAYECDFEHHPKNWISDLSYKNLIGDAPHPKHEPVPDSKEGTRYFFGQWFTGPLLMPSSTTADPRHPCMEPGVTVSSNYGDYGNNWKIDYSNPTFWTVNYLMYWQMGFTQRIGLEAITSLNSNYQGSISSTQFTDTLVRLGYQISNDKHIKGNWTPDFRIIFEEQFPTGRYHKLNSANNSLDASGSGAFTTGGWLALQKGFAWSSNHAFNLGAALGYFLQSSAKVKGLNAYGGNHFTDGRIYPGNIVSVYFSGEFEITNHLGVAFDSNYLQTFSGSFEGNQGSGAPTLLPQSVFFQLAFPEVEIIINEQAGFLIGPWYTFSGQNTPAFVSLFAYFLYIF